MDNIVTVTTTVSVGGVTKVFAANGETSGSPHRLVRSLAHSVAGDVTDWAIDQKDKPEPTGKPELIGGWLDATSL